MEACVPSFRPTRLVQPVALARPSQPRPLVSLAVAVASLALLNAFAVPDLSLTNRGLASLICMVCWVPLIRHIWSGPAGLPFMPILCLAHSAVYAWAVFLSSDLTSGVFADDLISMSLMLTLIGVCCLIAGYYLVPDRSLTLVPRVKILFDATQGAQTAAMTGVFAVVAAAIPASLGIPARFSAIFEIASQLFSFSIAMLFYYHLLGCLTPSYRILLWGVLVPIRVTQSLSSGAVAQVVLDIMLLMGTYWVARKRWPWKVGLIFGLLVIPLLGVKGEYRKVAWDGPSMNDIDKTSLFLGMVVDGFVKQDGFVVTSSQAALNRLDQTTTFCLVLNLTPNVIPYWRGESYETLYWMLIPRFLYPDKPSKSIGQDFGHRYGLLNKRDTSTSYNCPQLVEMYANFGPWGVVVGMFLLGVVCRMLYYALSGPNAGEGTLMIAVVVFTHLCDVESDLSIVFGGLLLNILALVVVVRLFHTRSVRLP